MTEELRQKAKNYAWNYPIPYSLYEKIEDKKEQMGEVIEQAYLDGAEENEKKLKNLKEKLNTCKFAMIMSENVEKQLKEQIEKMKCCENCKHSYNEEQYITTDYCNDCFDFNKWELKE